MRPTGTAKQLHDQLRHQKKKLAAQLGTDTEPVDAEPGSEWQEIVQASSEAQEIEDKIVPWDKLEKGKLYQLLTGVELAYDRHLRILGPYYARAGGIIRVLEVDRTERNHPWYRVRLIKMATIGSQDDIPGWIDGKDLKKKGVAEQQ